MHSNRDTTTKTATVGVYAGTSANTFSGSHFEGGLTPSILAGTANVAEGGEF